MTGKSVKKIQKLYMTQLKAQLLNAQTTVAYHQAIAEIHPDMRARAIQDRKESMELVRRIEKAIDEEKGHIAARKENK